MQYLTLCVFYRIKNMETKSVEQMLFKAFPKDTVTMTHISRASLTAPGGINNYLEFY